MSAFLLTWSPKDWPHPNIVKLVEIFEAHGYVDEPWRIIASNLAKSGDRAWALKQGRGQKGIFGAGHMMAAPSLTYVGNGKRQMNAPVRFEALVDPLKGFLIGEAAAKQIPGDRTKVRASKR